MGYSQRSGGIRGSRFWVPVFSGFSGLVLVLWATAGGIGLTPDAAHYLGTARNLLAGKGYVSFHGAYPPYPPLFSTLVAFLGLWTDVFTSARLINALCFGALVFMSSRLFFEALSSRGLVLCATASVLFSPKLLHISSCALSDPLFILLSFLCVYFLSSSINPAASQGEKKYFFAFACFIAGLSCLQRYAGIVLAGVALISFVFFRREISWKKRLWVSGFSGAAMVLPLCVWVLLTHYWASTLGVWPSSRETARSIFVAFLDPFTNWFLPSAAPLALRSFLVLALIGFVLSRVRLRAPVWLIFIVAYSGFLVFSAMAIYLTNQGRFEERYLLPLYAPVIFLIFLSIDLFLKQKKRWVGPVVFFCVAWCIFSFYRVCKNISLYQARGVAVFNREIFFDKFHIA